MLGFSKPEYPADAIFECLSCKLKLSNQEMIAHRRMHLLNGDNIKVKAPDGTVYIHPFSYHLFMNKGKIHLEYVTLY